MSTGDRFTVTANHGEIAVSWKAWVPPASPQAIAELRLDGDRQVADRCVMTRTGCTFEGLTDGITYTVTVTHQGAGATTHQGAGATTHQGAGATDQPDQNGVRAIPRPSILGNKSTRLWLDGADPASLDTQDGDLPRIGSVLRSWRDKSVLRNDAAHRDGFPTPTVGSVGRHTAVRFTAGEALAMASSGLPVGTAPSTVYAVAVSDDEKGATSCFQHILAWGNPVPGGGRILHKGCHTRLAYAEIYDTWTQSQPVYGWDPHRTCLFQARFTQIGVDSQMNGKPSSRWQTSTSGIRMMTGQGGMASVGGAPWDSHGGTWEGEIAEIIVLNTVPTTDQDRQINSYLVTKWGL